MVTPSYFISSRLVLLTLLLIVSTPVLSAESLPKDLIEVGITASVGKKLPLDTPLTNSHGEHIVLGDLLKTNEPLILTFVYYRCPMLCSLLLDGVKEALQKQKKLPGDGYRVASISFDPTDSYETAHAFQTKYSAAFSEELKPDAWSFLVGSPESIQTLTSAVGFHYNFLENSGEFAHSATVIFISPDGTISRYLYGVMFDPLQVRLGVLDASNRKTISTIDQGLLFCYNYDPQARSYVIHSMNLMKAAGILSILLIAGFVFYLLRLEKTGYK
ncbi:SCO family protein [bacterium]|jgi:protein SCO1|nr:SCO family protein [bacterium]